MDAGYDAPDGFARAFRQRFGQSPSSFRKSPDWEPWLAAFGPLDNARSKHMQTTFTTDDVTIRDVPPTPVAIMEHRGDPATLGATIQRFIVWRTAAGLHPKTSPTFNVWRSERRPVSPADYSVDLCVGTDQPIEANGEQIKAGEIPGGRCAVLRVVGNTDNLEPAALYLYRDWLPASGEEARDPLSARLISSDPIYEGFLTTHIRRAGATIRRGVTGANPGANPPTSPGARRASRPGNPRRSRAPRIRVGK
jgi:AraC family transcriptional regulator